MSEFLAFAQLGFRHIVALDAADHILFLFALAAIYRGRDWKAALWVISAFTLGHSVTLALAVANLLVVPRTVVEFLIPVTIVLTGIENLLIRERAAAGPFARHRPVFAAVFGLVHGAGFADYLRGLFVDHIAVPLFSFNVGIELGQIVVIAATAVLFLVIDHAIVYVRGGTPRRQPFQWRLIGVSALITLVAAVWTWERWPW